MGGLVWRILRKFLFAIDAESAHRITVGLIRFGIRLGNIPLQLASGARSAEGSVLIQVAGMTFQSRVGLAAGFDKDAEILKGLPALGFGFAEIGTVTPRPQPGNPRPRLFRNPDTQGLFNRMGFNGLGASIVSERLRRARPDLPPHFRVGVNIGKNKDTPLEGARLDYATAARAFEGLADYLVINVSSPNTPGLRSLQALDSLKPIIREVKSVTEKWGTKTPVFLKIAPEIEGEDLKTLIRGAESEGIDGWVLTNTLSGTRNGDQRGDPGGWSGGPLTQISRQRLQEARTLSRLTIISVGGIMDAEEAALRIRLGADLIQLYSGWIYGGPAFPVRISQKLRNSAGK